jgi:DNA polymerase-3 subunit delta'
VGPGSEAGVDEKPPEMPPPPAPVPLSSIVGQERAIEVLRSSLRSGRPHHGWIFHGPPGVGKFTAAVAFAAVLLDPTSAPDGVGDVAPDPRSTVQRALREGAHPDLHIVRKELALYSSDPRVRASKQMTIAKDVVRQHLIEPSTRSALLAPGGLARKVFVVDEAELLDPSPTNAPSQNALLKTLEEPPEGTVIILVTSNADRLLPTVRSRCQRVAFGTLGEDGLRLVADRLGVPTSGPVWDRLTLLAGGSPGRLVDAYRTGVEEWWAELEPRLDRVASGRADATLGQRMAELVEAWAKRQVELAPHASKDSMNRRGASRMFHLVAEHARRRLGSKGPIGPPLRQIDAVGEAERRLATNAQVSMVFEALSAELVAAGGG